MPIITNPSGGINPDGGTMVGNLLFDSSAKIQFKDAGGDYRDVIDMDTDTITYGATTNPTAIQGLTSPSYSDGSDLWPLWNNSDPQAVRGTTNQVISSTTLADTEIGGAVPGNSSRMFFRYYVIYYAPAASDFSFAMNGPVGGVGEWCMWTDPGAEMTLMNSTKVNVNTGGTAMQGALIWGYWSSGVNPGNIIVEAALQSASGNGSVYNAGAGFTQNTADWPSVA